MTNEQFERKMEFIVETLSQVAVNDQRHGANHQLHIARLDRLERIAKLMVRAGLKERRTRSAADERLTKALADLAEAQKRTEASIAHTDTRLDALIDIVRRQHNGGA